MTKSKQTHAAKNNGSRARRREKRRADRAIRNGEDPAAGRERESVYVGAFIMCPECGTKCYELGGPNWYRCPRCKLSRELPDLVFSPVHFLALYQGGRLYAWRALESGNFPALRYSGVSIKREPHTQPTAVYSADIDIYHAAHYVGGRDDADKLCQHLNESARAALIDGLPVPVFFLEFKGVNC